MSAHRPRPTRRQSLASTQTRHETLLISDEVLAKFGRSLTVQLAALEARWPSHAILPFAELVRQAAPVQPAKATS